MFVVGATAPQASGMPSAAKRATMELVILAYNAANELCDRQGDSTGLAAEAAAPHSGRVRVSGSSHLHRRLRHLVAVTLVAVVTAFRHPSTSSSPPALIVTLPPVAAAAAALIAAFTAAVAAALAAAAIAASLAAAIAAALAAAVVSTTAPPPAPPPSPPPSPPPPAQIK